MPYKNGRLPKSALTEIQPGAFLATKTARAWKQLVAAAKKNLGRSISAANPAGAYRSAAAQHAMHLAGAGDDILAKLHWGLNPHSTVAIADDPWGTHQDGTRIDIIGTPIDARFLALAKKYGFSREFGAKDPNHFLHDGKTATSPIIAAVTPRATPKPKKLSVKVRAGDTLDKIATANRTTKARLLLLNPTIVDPDLVRLGQSIRVR